MGPHADTRLKRHARAHLASGGIYIAPADTLMLCDACMKVLDLVLEG